MPPWRNSAEGRAPSSQVALHLYADLVTTVPFFQQCSAAFLTELILQLGSQTLSPGDSLYEVREWLPPRTKRTRRVPHPVLIGHTASLTPIIYKHPLPHGSGGSNIPLLTNGRERLYKHPLSHGGGGSAPEQLAANDPLPPLQPPTTTFAFPLRVPLPY
jgi:hypothetical protein